MYEVMVDNYFWKVKDTLFDPDKLKEIVMKNASVEMFWFPFNSLKPLEAVDSVLSGAVSDFDWNPMVDDVWMRLINPIKEGQLHLPPVGK